MNTETITAFESRLGRMLPDDYRTFLCSHSESWLAQPRVFDSPRSGIIDQLFTIDQILKNESQDAIGIPDLSLLYIGDNLMGGSLYLKVSDEEYGHIHYMEQYQFCARFTSFTEFLSQTHDQREDA